MTAHSEHSGTEPAGVDIESGETLFSATVALWSLFISLAAGMLSMGLLGPLLAIRADLDGFTTETTGLVMTGYFAGFLVSSQLTPRLVASVGHVRVFAAMASLASIAPLVHALVVDPYVWFAARMVTGFSYAGIYIVAESWLNARASNRNRGKLLSIYMVIMIGAMAGGPLLLNLSHPLAMDLFILASILVSASLIPILLAATPVPSYEEPEKISIVKLYGMAPLSVVGMVVVGLTNGGLIAMAPVYGNDIGMSVAEVSLLTFATLLGTVVTQWPIGWISDRFDRRWVLTGVTFGAAAVAGLGFFAITLPFLAKCAVGAFLGGLVFPMYSLCLAHANDRLTTQQMMAASSTLVLLSGIGAIGGPYSASWLMAQIGPQGFFLYFVVLQGGLGLYALWRMTQRAATPLDEQEHSLGYTQTVAVSPVFIPEAYVDLEDVPDDEPVTTDSAQAGA